MDTVDNLINVLKKAHSSALQLDTSMQGDNALLVNDIVGSLSKAITSLEKAPLAKDSKRRNHSAKHTGDKRRNIDAKSCTKIVCENPDDTYVWRKYGQKEIQGLKYPRCYYRCTNKYDLKCQATKQVQQCEDDPSKYEITYIGKHTCTDFYNNQESDDSSFFINFSSSNLSPEKSQCFPIPYSSLINLSDSEIIQVQDVPSTGISMHDNLDFPDLTCDVPLMDDHTLSPSIQSSSESAGTTADFNETLRRLDEPYPIDPFDEFLTNMGVNSNLWNDFSLRLG